ncbi:MAG: redoxin domain-containing protein [bacterium]|nr:redoxin domain-containing protein [bacterium]
MKIETGQLAPAFNTVDVRGEEMTVPNSKKRYILLSFMRGADCPFCNLRVLQLLIHQESLLSLGIETCLIFKATNQKLNQNISKTKPSKFRIIGDHDMSIHQLYHTEASWMGSLRSLGKLGVMIQAIKKKVFKMSSLLDLYPVLPADFLVDQDGKVIMYHYGKDYSDNIKIESVIDKVVSLNTETSIGA